jgi:hypothetical protein
VDALPDHAALKLGESIADLKHQLAYGGGRVDRLLVFPQSASVAEDHLI